MGKFSTRWRRASLAATLLLFTVPAVAGVVRTGSGLVRGVSLGVI